MANAYKVSITTLNAVNTNFTVLTASASTTLVKSVSFTHDDHNCSVTMGLTKSGGSRVDLLTKTHTADEMTQLNNDVIALEAGDALTVASTHISASDVGYVTVVYVENTTSVSGQSIDVLTDVDITTSAPTNGQTLVWNDSANEFQPGDAGGSTATLDDIGNVDTTGKVTNDVLLWDGSEWVESQRLSLVYELLKEGTSKTITAEPTNADETEGFVKLEATNAKLKVNKTGVDISETSPGTVTFQVATDSSGTTEFDAAALTGLNTANEAQFIMKHGTQLVCESSNAAQGRVIYDGTGNSLLKLPTSSGQIANTSDISTDSAVVANTAKVSADGSVTTHNDVSSAGSGSIITSAERTKLSGIATGATANQTDAHLLNRSNHTGTQTASTISDFANAADLRIASASVEDLNDITDAGSGEIITSAERTKLTGIAAGAEVNVIESLVDDTTPQLGGNLDVQSNVIQTSATNGSIRLVPNGTGTIQVEGDGSSGKITLMCDAGTHGVSIESPPHSAAATYTLVLPDDAGSANQVLKTDGSGNLSWTNQSTGGGSPTAYEEDSFETSANITMNSSVSTASNKVVDIMGDALAAKDNANAKKLLGFHTGSGVCVLQGMVDAGASITGASAGSPLWLGASGAFSATAPSTANEYSRVMGYYIATLQGGEVMCYFNPSIDWIQID